MLLLRQTTVPTVITSFYIVFLGSYRGLYLVNWFIRELDSSDRKPNTISVLFGIIQTALYVDFAWVYWTRQRVKLRNGGVVDADDLRRGWLLSRIFGNKRLVPDHGDGEDEESAPALGGSRNYNHHGAAEDEGGLRVGGSSGPRAARAKWGARGISVSADDGVLEHERSLGDEEHGVTDGANMDPDAKMQDPDELARALDDDDSDEDAPLSGAKKISAGTSEGTHNTSRGEASGVRNGDEWNDD